MVHHEMVLWKILVISLVLSPFVSGDERPDEYGPFGGDLPLAQKLRGLHYELKNDREEEMGIAEEVQRQVEKQKEIAHSLIDSPKPKVAHIPTIEELLADLPLPMLQQVENKRKELRSKTQGGRESEASAETPSASQDPPVDKELSSLLEANAQSSAFPPQVPPPPIEFSQASEPLSSPQEDELPLSSSPSLSDRGDSLPSLPSASSSSPLQLLQSTPDDDLSFPPPPDYPLPNFNNIPYNPPRQQSYQPEAMNDPDSSFSSRPRRIASRPLRRTNNAAVAYASAPSFEESETEPQEQVQPVVQRQAHRPQQQQQVVRHPQRLRRRAPNPQQQQQTHLVQQQQQQQQQQQRGSYPNARYRRRPQRRAPRALQPVEGFPPPLGYSSLVEEPSSVSVVAGIPLFMKPSSSNNNFLQTDEEYASDADDAISVPRRTHVHHEPLLPDLPSPPVVPPL